MATNKPPRKTIRSARFDTRLSQEQKTLFEQAASIKGYKSLSEFVVQVVQEAASNILEEHQSIILTEQDREIFFKALDNPPKPGKNLLKAAKEYKRLTSGK
ncbi:MAG: DUF1778 domain-containing protein [Bacteroidota bacterium]